MKPVPPWLQKMADQNGGLGDITADLQKIADEWRASWPEFNAYYPMPACECGAKAVGAKDYAPGHSPWCPVVSP